MRKQVQVLPVQLRKARGDGGEEGGWVMGHCRASCDGGGGGGGKGGGGVRRRAVPAPLGDSVFVGEEGGEHNEEEGKEREEGWAVAD